MNSPDPRILKILGDAVIHLNGVKAKPKVLEHPCGLKKVSRKCKLRIISQMNEFAIPFIEANIALGRWLEIDAPIHLQNVTTPEPLTSWERDWFNLHFENIQEKVLCPLCDHIIYCSNNNHLTVINLNCYACGTVFWILDDDLDLYRNWDEYVEQAENYRGEDPWGEAGIPVEVYQHVTGLKKLPPKVEKKQTKVQVW